MIFDLAGPAGAGGCGRNPRDASRGALFVEAPIKVA